MIITSIFKNFEYSLYSFLTRISINRIFLIVVLFGLVACSTKTFDDPEEKPKSYDGNLPHIYIETENQASIGSREDYVQASISIDGKGIYQDFEGYTKIKGRGTSSWNYKPKKPYKLNLYYPRPLFGFTPYKKWILLAEYLDGSMLCNSVPFEMAKMLGMPYTNTIIPAQLTLNGNYQGFYAFTEHKEVGKERIDIGEDGVLLELDVYMDEDWQFKSDKYKLPVIVKYPKEKDGRMNQAVFDEIKDDFNQFEALVYDNSFPNNDYLEYFDKQAFANYMVVFLFTLNREITHPKSVYIHKKAGGKYEMSIVWDFDQGYGFGVNETHYDLSTANAPLFLTGNYRTGNRFFKRLMTDPELQDMVRERWTWFRNYKYAELRQHVEQYAKLVEEAFYEDHKIWGDRGSSNDLNEDLYRVLDWLDARALYLDNYVISFTE